MHLTRHAVSRAASAFARAGWRVRLVDLKGCGDSSGEHGDVRWQDWVDDLRRVLPLAAEGPVCFWTLRAGALLAAALAHSLAAEWSRAGRRIDWLLWQPERVGAQVLDRWLAGPDAGPGHEHADGRALADMRRQLVSGYAVQVDGDAVHPLLAAALDQARLDLPAAITGRVLWFEQGAGDPALPEASRRAVEALRQQGREIDAVGLPGADPLQAGNRLELARLIELSTAGLQELARAAQAGAAVAPHPRRRSTDGVRAAHTPLAAAGAGHLLA